MGKRWKVLVSDYNLLNERIRCSDKRYLILSRSFIPFEKTSDWNTYDRSDTRPRVSTAEHANVAVSRKAVANAWAKPAQGNR
jgi:hypothetical protein